MSETAFRYAFRMRKAYSRQARARRMRLFLDLVDPAPGTRVIDLGGVQSFWANCPVPLDLTLLNLPSAKQRTIQPSHHVVRLVEGDARETEFADGAFDLAFSNSVIEHVGGARERARMAGEVRRLAPRYWVQTPSIWFPVEAHTVMPMWWFYPAPLRRWFMARWRRRRPAWAHMVEETTVVRRREMADLFPEAEIHVERRAGIPKSYIACRA